MIYQEIIPEKIIYTRKKSISLIINNDAELIVRAPLNCPNSKIYDFILKKSNWIIKKKDEIRSQSQYNKLTLQEGENVFVFGRPFKIVLIDSNRVRIIEDKIYLPRLNTRTRLINSLARLARDYISRRVEYYARKYDLKYKSIRITSAHTRWGSCSYYNRLNFTYKLIMCPEYVIDYIIVHELSHTLVKNHSKGFYKQVASILPNYKEAEQWLNDNRKIIMMI